MKIPMPLLAKNLFTDLRIRSGEESFDDLVRCQNFRLERIVSTGQCSPPDFWYEQDLDEWVAVLQGEARIRIESESSHRTLGPGDHILLKAGLRHRVEWTDPTQPTVWLALHFDSSGPSRSTPCCEGT